MTKVLGWLIVMASVCWWAPAQARVHIDIDLTTQTMNVESATGSYSWPISSARAGYYTPHGTFAPQSLQQMHYSRKYYHSPMPHSIFFAGGYAIHGTYETGALGRPASHGCVRISPGNAAVLYELVQAEGATITIHGNPPASHYYAEGGHRYHHGHHYYYYGSTSYPYGGAMAYAPGHYNYYPGVQQWQYNPYYGQ